MRWLFVLVLLVWVPCSSLIADDAGKGNWQRLTYQEQHMGVWVKFTLYSRDQAIANKAAEAAFARIAELDRLLSDYNPKSELRQLCDQAKPGEAVPISDDLFAVLQEAQKLSKTTDGAFDVTVGPVVRLWRRARRQKKMPEADRLKEAQSLIGFELITLDEKDRTVVLAKTGMRLDLGGIAKGYAGDEALKEFKKRNITRVMIDAGGDLVLGDPPPRKAGWRVGIAPLDQADGKPTRVLLLKNVSIATSGDVFQFVEIAGKRYSHIVDPKTGLGLTVRSSVSVIAPTGMQADSLASAVSVLGPKKGLKLIESTKGAEALIVLGETKEAFSTKLFSDYELDRRSLDLNSHD